MVPARLDSRRDCFHTIISVLGLPGCTDLHAVLGECHRVLRPDGWLSLATYAKSAFQPYAGLLRKRLERAGVCGLELSWATSNCAEALQAALAEVDFENVHVKQLRLGYHLLDAQAWWYVVEYGELRDWITWLPTNLWASLRSDHLAEVVVREPKEGLRKDCGSMFLFC